MDEKPSWSETVRGHIGLVVVGTGMLVVAIFSIVVVIAVEQKDRVEVTKLLLASVLPVLGTWVGTVLAYYFAKENLETATRTTKELAGIDEKLRSVPVTTAMIPIDKADKWQLAENEKPEGLNLTVLMKQMDDAKPTKRNRLPVLNAAGAGIYVIHRSSLTDFIAEESLGAAPGTAAKDLAISDLTTKRADLFCMITGWACVKRAATLSDAKKAMEALSGCSDIFVTESGRPSEPVLGWITNADISLHSQA